MKDNLYTIIYATVLGTVCALLLTGAAKFTEPYQKSNKKAEKIRSILGVLDVSFSAEASSQELIDIFNENIKQEKKGQLDMYLFSPPEANGQIKAAAVNFEGSGLWGPIKGFISLKSDMKTIQGVVVYEQEETPGLGGDIASEAFCDRFKGKSILDENGKPGFQIIRDGSSTVNGIDTISGATITCDKLEDMLNEAINKIHLTQKE